MFLILVVLLQQGRGGGLGGAFGGTTQQVFGGGGAGNFMTRLTWGCAMVFILTSVSLAYIASSGDRSLKAREGQSSGQKP
jgi:preprotein translocase subunit SecG